MRALAGSRARAAHRVPAEQQGKRHGGRSPRRQTRIPHRLPQMLHSFSFFLPSSPFLPPLSISLNDKEARKVRARTASAGVARTPCGSLRSIGCVFVSDAWARPPRAARLGFHSWIAARIGDKSALAARVQCARAARRCKRADRRECAPLLQLVNRTGGRVVLSREGVEGRQSVRCGTAKRFACTAEASVPEGVVGALSYEF